MRSRLKNASLLSPGKLWSSQPCYLLVLTITQNNTEHKQLINVIFKRQAKIAQSIKEKWPPSPKSCRSPAPRAQWAYMASWRKEYGWVKSATWRSCCSFYPGKPREQQKEGEWRSVLILWSPMHQPQVPPHAEAFQSWALGNSLWNNQVLATQVWHEYANKNTQVSHFMPLDLFRNSATNHE